MANAGPTKIIISVTHSIFTLTDRLSGDQVRTGNRFFFNYLIWGKTLIKIGGNYPRGKLSKSSYSWEAVTMVPIAENLSNSHMELGKLALSWLDHDLLARLVVDRQLEIIWKNAAAGAALARRDDVECRSGKLATTDRTKQIELECLVLDSTRSSVSWCLPRTHGHGHLIFTSQCIHWGDGGTYGVTFFSTGGDFKARYANLRTAFALTNSEGKVIDELLRGNDAEQIARAASLSVETVRTHIRNIYGKLHVNSREGLFHRVGPYRIL